MSFKTQVIELPWTNKTSLKHSLFPFLHGGLDAFNLLKLWFCNGDDFINSYTFINT